MNSSLLASFKIFINGLLTLTWEEEQLKRLIKKGLAFVFLVFLSNLLNVYFWGYPLDILTPFLIFNFIVEDQKNSLSLSFLASSFMEGQSFLPFGYYYLSYFTIALLINSLKEYVCWDNFSSWLMSLVGALLWLFSLELILNLENHSLQEVFLRLSPVGAMRLLSAVTVFVFLDIIGSLVLNKESLQ